MQPWSLTRVCCFTSRDPQELQQSKRAKRAVNAVQAEPADPALPGWRVERRTNDAGRSWKVYFGPNGERESTHAGARRAAARVATPPLPPPLPTGWTQHAGADGRAYYNNAMTGQAQWQRPF